MNDQIRYGRRWVYKTSTFDFPKFGQNDPAFRFRFRAEKSNSCQARDRALAKAFIRADATLDSEAIGKWSEKRSNYSVSAFARLVAKATSRD